MIYKSPSGQDIETTCKFFENLPVFGLSRLTFGRLAEKTRRSLS